MFYRSAPYNCRAFTPSLSLAVAIYMSNGPFPYKMMFVSFNRNTTGDTRGAGTTSPSGAHEFIPVVQQSWYSSIFSFLCNAWYIVVCPFVLFRLTIVFSVLLRGFYNIIFFKRLLKQAACYSNSNFACTCPCSLP